MTKKLEELFNLPSTEATPEEAEQTIAENRELITDVDSAIDRIDAALPTVHDLDTGDKELDELAKLAKEKGDKVYFTGKSCPKGHTADRYVESGGCGRCDGIEFGVGRHQFTAAKTLACGYMNQLKRRLQWKPLHSKSMA